MRAYFNSDNYISVEKMATKAGVARSTFYLHHQAVGKIVADYRNFLLRKFSRTMKRAVESDGVTMKRVISEMLFFTLRERRCFEVLTRGGETVIFVRMMRRLKPWLAEKMRLSGKTERIYAVYANEVAAIMDEWRMIDFDETKMEVVLGDIMYLTETAWERLSKLRMLVS